MVRLLYFMKKNVLILFLFLGFFTKAQYNLVPNPSFESYSNCPTTNNQLNYATGWINPTTSGTPDYYNSCSSSFGVPSYCYCSSVFQYPRTGNAYSGIWCYDKMVNNAREYMQIQITNTLITTSANIYNGNPAFNDPAIYNFGIKPISSAKGIGDGSIQLNSIIMSDIKGLPRNFPGGPIDAGAYNNQ